ncbi:hypothetical protein FRX31_017308 [Thalictrum thalictroides]|uniref:Ubiquitin-like domain-containing protein n=1 Tax=Thalictrum thalictroides TaxID=46969 RepID=A0A7J6W6U5_THATH|nr:hypothetical protein FRX31_017308 [Thalictrum thalictroides]
MVTPDVESDIELSDVESGEDGIVCVADIKKVITIKDLKAYFEQEQGIPADEQMFVRENEILYDAILLELLEVLPGKMQLYQKISPDESIAVEISPELLEGGRLPDLVLTITGGKCVSDLKLMIQKELGVPPARQYLTSMGIKMNDELPLCEYIAVRPPKFFLKETKEDLNNSSESDNSIDLS